MVDSGVKHFGGCLPATVEVAARERTPVVTVDDAVGIEHWYHFDYKVFSQETRLLILRIGQEAQNSSNHVGAHGFAWMDTTADYNSLLLAIWTLLIAFASRADRENFTVFPSQGFT